MNTPHLDRSKIMLALVIVSLLLSCGPKPGKPISTTIPKALPAKVLPFEQGIRTLAINLRWALEHSAAAAGSALEALQQQQVTSLVMDPFVDAESGYPVKASATIEQMISGDLAPRFEVLALMAPGTLQRADCVLNGLVRLHREPGRQDPYYKVIATVFHKGSGVVLAAASVAVSNFDTTPLELYRDSGVFAKGRTYREYVSSVGKSPGDIVEVDYRDTLASRAVRMEADRLYEAGDFSGSLSSYAEAARGQTGPELETLNGQFVNLVKLQQWANAAAVYAQLVRTSIGETGLVVSKITFPPGSIEPVSNKTALYDIYTEQIARLITSVPGCRAEISGHASRTGSEEANDRLSRQRAEAIQRRMAAYGRDVTSKSVAVGRGFRENIVGTGTDDVTDEIDRRVEFRFTGCGEGQ